MEFVFRRSYRGPLKAVLLDWAGTTMDYGCMAPAVVFMDVFKRKGVEITVDEAREPMGAHKKVHIRQITKNEAVAKRWEQKHGRRPTEADVEAMFEDFVPLQLQCLARYADLIPGTLEAVAEFRRRGLKVGSTTGYMEEMMAILQDEARRRGYVPDSTVCASQVPAGRPHPFMCLQNAINLQTYPMEAFVKIGDTLPDIEEGLNAGMWTIGLAKTGNEMGLTEGEIAALDPEARSARMARAYKRMAQAGAHYVVDGIADVAPLLDEIDARLARGERP
ncbi:MAG TPA: phosphonoacetaldehyde hydrolase [Longimicrobiales bacterium]|nr:phosphonoacetaldehyde hydrolase [Longimicrobiales bacterium]